MMCKQGVYARTKNGESRERETRNEIVGGFQWRKTRLSKIVNYVNFVIVLLFLTYFHIWSFLVSLSIFWFVIWFFFFFFLINFS